MQQQEFFEKRHIVTLYYPSYNPFEVYLNMVSNEKSINLFVMDIQAIYTSFNAEFALEEIFLQDNLISLT